MAELGASFIGAIVGFKVEEREDHAAYIEHWLQLWRGEHNFSNREVSIM
ncbi:antirestriction protein ArdC [Sphingomonas yabuuchiae]|uniref:Antirestriction protein ArdC n=1 Tax=Sphingomonas yabuuchiae TaxID=172044 RepID=A0ABR6KBH4_9SPHN|nr:antirestriction protein ArdC [Sphingomonas yabuuchiae]